MTDTRTRMRNGGRIRLGILFVCLFVFSPSSAQSTFGGIYLQARHKINDRWAARGCALIGREFGKTESWVASCDAGAGYSLSDEAVIAVYAKTSIANYIHMSNHDAEMSVVESISWRRASGLFFGFYFEQRRLFYQPSDYTKNVSAYGGIVGFEKSWDKLGLRGRAGFHIVCNMKSPSTKSEFIQRIKIPISLRKRVSESIALGISYTYGAMGETQIYIADRNGLNTINAAIYWTL